MPDQTVKGFKEKLPDFLALGSMITVIGGLGLALYSMRYEKFDLVALSVALVAVAAIGMSIASKK